MKRFVFPTSAALLALVVLPGIASAQSLGELARREEERRKTITQKGKVYTVETIGAPAAPRPATGSPATTAPAAPPTPSGTAPPTPSGAAPPSPSGQPPAAQAGQPPPPTAPAPDARADEATWRKRVQSERDQLQRAQMFADALQSRINALTADFAARDDPNQRQQLSTDRQKALAELDRVKQEILDRNKAIAAIQEEARKSGVPPGWVR